MSSHLNNDSTAPSSAGSSTASGRRNFLKTSVGVAAGAAALSPSRIVGAAHAAGRDVIRLADRVRSVTDSQRRA